MAITHSVILSAAKDLARVAMGAILLRVEPVGSTGVMSRALPMTNCADSAHTAGHRRKRFTEEGTIMSHATRPRAFRHVGSLLRKRRRACAAVEPLEVRRLLSAGDVDSGFGTGGVVVTDFFGQHDEAVV